MKVFCFLFSFKLPQVESNCPSMYRETPEAWLTSHFCIFSLAFSIQRGPVDAAGWIFQSATWVGLTDLTTLFLLPFQTQLPLIWLQVEQLESLQELLGLWSWQVFISWINQWAKHWNCSIYSMHSPEMRTFAWTIRHIKENVASQGCHTTRTQYLKLIVKAIQINLATCCEGEARWKKSVNHCLF